MTDLDKKYDPPTREMLDDPGGIQLPGLRDVYVIFRAVCGGQGYFCSAGFRDHEGYGGGETPREALRSLAKNLHALADQVDRAADF